MLDCHIVEGGYNAEQFLIAFMKVVVPQLNPYPQSHSVVVMDNCPGLHAQAEMIQAVRDKGARIIWLEPYDPEHNPIELAFRTGKLDLQRDQEALAFLPRRERLRKVLMRVDDRAARSHFRECGYPVP
jgi:hypothetical protein